MFVRGSSSWILSLKLWPLTVSIDQTTAPLVSAVVMPYDAVGHFALACFNHVADSLLLLLILLLLQLLQLVPILLLQCLLLQLLLLLLVLLLHGHAQTMLSGSAIKAPI